MTRPPDTGAQLSGSTCMGGAARPVTAADLAARVRVAVDRLVPAGPRVVVDPPVGALVHLPVVVSADGAGRGSGPAGFGPVTQTFTELGVPVAVTVAPVGFDWTVDGRAGALHSSTAGRRYDGHDPTLRDGYYVSATFGRPGGHSVGCTVRWQGRWSAPGFGEVPVPGEVTRSSAQPTTFTVHEARAVLVSGE